MSARKRPNEFFLVQQALWHGGFEIQLGFRALHVKQHACLDSWDCWGFIQLEWCWQVLVELGGKDLLESQELARWKKNLPESIPIGQRQLNSEQECLFSWVELVPELSFCISWLLPWSSLQHLELRQQALHWQPQELEQIWLRQVSQQQEVQQPFLFSKPSPKLAIWQLLPWLLILKPTIVALPRTFSQPLGLLLPQLTWSIPLLLILSPRPCLLHSLFGRLQPQLSPGYSFFSLALLRQNTNGQLLLEQALRPGQLKLLPVEPWLTLVI